jgi:predicted amidohydrolase YtcJ
VRDSAGHPTGRVTEAGFRALVGKLPQAAPAAVEASTLGMIKDLNRAGLTAFGVAGCDADLIGLYKKWAAEDKLNVRTYCINGVGMGNTAEQIDRALPRIAEMKLFQGDNYVDDIFYGESVYGAAARSDVHQEVGSEAGATGALAKDRNRDRQRPPAAPRPRQPDRHD